RGAAITWFVQDKRHIGFPTRLEAPIVKQKFAKPGTLNSLQELFGNNLIGVDICPIERNNEAGVDAKRFHNACYLNCHSLTSVKCPAIAAAAAIIGLTR